MITGALIGNYIDMYRVLQAKRSRRSLADVAKILATVANGATAWARPNARPPASSAANWKNAWKCCKSWTPI